MSTGSGALRVSRGIPTRTWLAIVAAIVAAAVAITLWVAITGQDETGATSTVQSGQQIEDSGRANPGREPAGPPATDRPTVGGAPEYGRNPLI